MKKLLLCIFTSSLSLVSVDAARPTVHSSNISFSELNCNSVKLSWTSGNGAARMIVARESGATTYTPVDGGQYIPDPSFGASAEYPNTGSGNFIVYNNTSSSVVITNLKPGQTYYFSIEAFNEKGVSPISKVTGPL